MALKFKIMEIVFAIIALILGTGVCYTAGRLACDSHAQWWRFTKSDELQLYMYVFITLMMSVIIWITLGAFNNTFWHLPYYFYN